MLLVLCNFCPDCIGSLKLDFLDLQDDIETSHDVTSVLRLMLCLHLHTRLTASVQHRINQPFQSCVLI
uniref:Uncharacterized protein n=1 Tax=Pararge aegeria TaxID=116150 RepID=S4PXU5_9NEOP